MLNNQCWWITGASSGIGEALARALSARGVSLILSGRNVEALEALAKSCGDALVLPFEATDFDELSNVTEQAWDWKGKVDGLVNNAGVSQRSMAVDTTFEVYRSLINIDLLAPIALTQEILPLMVQAGGGKIVCISSVAGIVGVPLRSAYCAAKHGIIGYHDSIRAENEHLGIQVHVIAPGSVKTNVAKNALDSDGTARNISDANIDNGMSPRMVADNIIDSIETGRRELILAEGLELEMATLRRQDPDALFDRVAALVSDGYLEKALDT